MKYVIVCVFLCTAVLAAQTQEWAVRYDGPANAADVGLAIAVDVHGNVYVTGRRADTPSLFECTTIKYDASGNQKWLRTYHRSDSIRYDMGWDIALDNYGNVYVAVSSTDSLTGVEDIAVIKYDTLGNFIWDARYNGSGNHHDMPFDIAVDGSGSVYITGRSAGTETGIDYVTIKWDSEGTEKWVARYNGPANQTDEAYSIAVDEQGYVYTTGTSTGVGTGLDFVTIKYDSLGNDMWVSRFNSIGNLDEIGSTLDIDNQGNVYVTGGTWKIMQGIPSDYLTIKYNEDGDTVWTRLYNMIGSVSDNDVPKAIVYDGHGNVYITGISNRGTQTRSDYCTVKYDTLGNLKWVRRYNGPTYQNDQANAIAVDDHGYVYVTGRSCGFVNDDYATVVYDSLGTEIAVQRYNGPGTTMYDEARDIVVDADGNFYITGISSGDGTFFDYATIKYSSVRMTKSVLSGKKKPTPLLPTIFYSNVQLPEKGDYKIYDISGRKIDIKHMKPGVFFIEIDGKAVQKIIKLK